MYHMVHNTATLYYVYVLYCIYMYLNHAMYMHHVVYNIATTSCTCIPQQVWIMSHTHYTVMITLHCQGSVTV